ncbi:MAG: class I SAM-dependent methyltransferase, partial [Legionella sp.]
MSKICPVCRSKDAQVRAAYRGSHPIFLGLERTHCSSCEMVFVSPMPTETALSEYNASYFSTAHGGTPSNKVTRAFFSGIARLRMTHIERYIQTQRIQVAKLLELGPGPGVFAKNWLEKYPTTSYMAYETDISCHPSLQKVGVTLLDSASRVGNSDVDLIVMSHVLEHVTDPIQFLTTSTQNLRKGGAIFIEVPCRDYEHKPLDEPHLLFFDKEPMRLLLQQLGFNNIQISYHGVTL